MFRKWSICMCWITSPGFCMALSFMTLPSLSRFLRFPGGVGPSGTAGALGLLARLLHEPGRGELLHLLRGDHGLLEVPLRGKLVNRCQHRAVRDKPTTACADLGSQRHWDD